MAKEKLTHKYLLSILSYNKRNGVFVWLVSRGRVKVGDIAGSVKPDGYTYIKIDKKDYGAHILACFYINEKWPTNDVDHIDGNRSNNKYKNIRVATRSQNKMNTKLRSDNTTGVKGVYFCNRTKKYQAQITLNGKNKYLGRYKTLKEARAAYCNAARELFGEFARFD